MPRYARTVFPRDPENANQFLAPHVVSVIGNELILAPKITSKTVAIDIELQQAEILPDATIAATDRAIELIQKVLPTFTVAATGETE